MVLLLGLGEFLGMFLPHNVPVVGPVWVPRLRRLGVSAYLEICICY